MMNNNYYAAIENRRSIYGISKDTEVSNQKIKEAIEHSVKHTPTAFNSQSGRVILLIGKEHDRLWDITKNALKQIVPEESFQATSDKIDSFQAGYGTVLFFEDMEVVETLQKSYPLYKDNFPLWSYQSSGMLQYNVWNSLSLEGLGASLQHYNELIENQVREQWKVPTTWKLMSQMPFGKPMSDAGEKEFIDVDQRFQTFGE